MIIVIRRNIDKVSGFPDIVLGDIYNRPNLLIKHKRRPPNQSCIKENVFKIHFFRSSNRNNNVFKKFVFTYTPVCRVY